jgi:hypothetical protein
MVPNIVTLAQAGGQAVAASPVTVVPPVATADGVTIPAARQASPAGAYFQLFKLCSCGHSSAWHSGAFGDAWRAGEQVEGGCEADDESSRTSCRCGSFRPASLG